MVHIVGKYTTFFFFTFNRIDSAPSQTRENLAQSNGIKYNLLTLGFSTENYLFCIQKRTFPMQQTLSNAFVAQGKLVWRAGVPLAHLMIFKMQFLYASQPHFSITAPNYFSFIFVPKFAISDNLVSPLFLLLLKGHPGTCMCAMLAPRMNCTFKMQILFNKFYRVYNFR